MWVSQVHDGGVGGYRYMMGRWGVRVLQIHDGGVAVTDT